MINVCFLISCPEAYGLGHFMRSVALAEVFINKKSKVFFLFQKKIDKNLKKYLDKKKIFLFDNLSKKIGKLNEEKLYKKIRCKKINFFFIDGYEFNANWQKEFKKNFSKSIKLVKIDDFITKNYCDYFIYFNSNKKKINQKYFKNKNCIKLIGTNYTLIRDEILEIKKKIKKTRSSNILISPGGKNWKNFCFKITKILNPLLKRTDIKIYVSSGTDIVADKDINLNICKDFKEQNKILILGPIVFGYSGYSAIERSVLNIPSINFCLNQNQRDIYQLLKKTNIIPSSSIYSKHFIKKLNNYIKSSSNKTMKNVSPYNIKGKYLVYDKLMNG